jgi:hypothetical protein
MGDDAVAKANEYEDELRELRKKLDQLRADEAAPDVIEEYASEWRNLRAIYQAAQETFAMGTDDAELQSVLAVLGFGDWTLANVYAFVYDAAMDADLDGDDLASIVNQTDYVASLRAASD